MGDFTQFVDNHDKGGDLGSFVDKDKQLAQSLLEGAQKLGADPVDYATAISYESARTFDPWVKGPVTKWGQHRGTIQFGQPQQKQYGVHQGQSFHEQVTDSNVRYLQDHGFKPGMGFTELYKAINGGKVSASTGTHDADTGRTIGDNLRLAAAHRQEVINRFAPYWNSTETPVAPLITPGEDTTSEVTPQEKQAFDERFPQQVTSPGYIDTQAEDNAAQLPDQVAELGAISDAALKGEKYVDPTSQVVLEGGYQQAPDQSNVADGVRVTKKGQTYIAKQVGDQFTVTPEKKTPQVNEADYKQWLPASGYDGDTPEARKAYSDALALSAQTPTTGDSQDNVQRLLTRWQSAPKPLDDTHLRSTDLSYHVQLPDGVNKEAYAQNVMRDRLAQEFDLTPEQAQKLRFSVPKLDANDKEIIARVNRGDLADVAGLDKVRADYEGERGEAIKSNTLAQNETADQRAAAQPLTNNPFTRPSGDPLMDQARANILADPFNVGTDKDVQKEYERLQKVTPSEAEKAATDKIGQWLSKLDVPGTLTGAVKGAAWLSDIATGAAKLSPLGLLDYATGQHVLDSTLANDARLVADSKNDTYVFEVGGQKIRPRALGEAVGSAAIQVPVYVGLSTLPGGAVMAFAATEGLGSVGRGENALQAGGATIKGGALGLLFSAAPRIGQFFADTASSAMVNPVLEAGKDLSKGQILASKLIGATAEIGTIGGGTFTIEKASGASNEDAFQSAIVNSLFGLSKYVPLNKLVGKTYRMHEGDNSADVTIDPDGSVKLLPKGKVPPGGIDAEMDLNGVVDMKPDAQGVYRAEGDVASGEKVAKAALQEAPAKRIEQPLPDAVARIALDTRAQKMGQILSDGTPKTVQEIAKETKYNPAKVNQTIELLYGAGKIEILPDGKIRLIEPLDKGTSLYDQFNEKGRVTKPVENPPTEETTAIEKPPIEKPVEQPENPSPGARYKGLTVTHPVSGEPLTFTGEVKDNGNLIAKNNFGRERTIAPRDADKWLETPNEKPVAPTPETPKTELQPKKAEPEKRKYKEPKFQSLSQFVRKMGGIRPTREDTGETRRISNKEMQTSGLINKNSQHTAEDMARLAYEFGYLRDVFESAEHVNGNDFMDHVEADQSGHHKYYSSMDDTERFSDEHFQRQYEEYAQKQEDKQKAAEEYKRKQDDLLAKQAAFLNDSEAKKHLAKMAAGEYKTTYDSFAGLEPQNDATREYFNYLDSKGIPSYAHADDVLRAYQEAPQSNAGADSHTDAVEPQSNNAGAGVEKPGPTERTPQERVNNLDPQITAKVLYAKERGMTPSDIAQRYDLTPEDVESVGALPKVGQSGQFSHMLIKSLIPSKTGTAEERADKIAAVNDLASELNLPNARLTREAPVGDISNVVDAIRLAIAKELGHERLSHAPSADILKWLDGHGDRLTQETVETILGALGHQIDHLETKVKPFLADKRLDDILERIDRLYGLDKIQDLDRIPNSDYKREILNLGYQYGLKRTAITRAYERASGNFQRRIAEGAREGISQGRGSVSPTPGQEKALSQRGLSPEKKLDPVQDKDLIESLKEDGGALYARSPQTDSPAFKKWFGDSKVVDENGRPLVVYHGTDAPEDFDVFEPHTWTDVYRLDGKEIQKANSWDIGKDGEGMPEGYHYGALSDAMSLGVDKALDFRRTENMKYSPSAGSIRHFKDLERLQGKTLTRHSERRPSGDGSYFAPNREYSFIAKAGIRDNGRVLPVFLSIQNPKYISHSEIEGAGLAVRVERAKAEGYDGFIAAKDPTNLPEFGWDGHTQIVAFDPAQIKSATGNNGNFDPTEPSILKSVPGQVNLWGNSTLHALQNTLFDTAPKSEAQLDRAEQKDLARAYGKTGDYIYRMLHSDDSQLASIATKLAEARFLAAQKEGGIDLVNDATDALDAFSYARKLKTSTQNILDQQGFDGKTFSDRLNDRSRSLLGAMEDGSFGKQFQLDLHNLKDSTPLFMVAWHGSPHRFDKFDISKIGTGEGAQAYGFGLYFTDKESVAEHYRNALASNEVEIRVGGKKFLNGNTIGTDAGYSAYRIAAFANRYTKHFENFEQLAKEYKAHLESQVKNFTQAAGDGKGSGYSEMATKAQGELDALPALLRLKPVLGEKPGAKYRVDLKPEPDEYLLWDKPLSEQSEKVQTALQPIIQQWEDDANHPQPERRTFPKWLEDVANGTVTGQQIYHATPGRGQDKTDLLLSLGIRGIKYLDGSSRGKGEGSYNYVIFDHNDVEIQEVHYSKLDDESKLAKRIDSKIAKKSPLEIFKSAKFSVTPDGMLTAENMEALSIFTSAANGISKQSGGFIGAYFNRGQAFLLRLGLFDLHSGIKPEFKKSVGNLIAAIDRAIDPDHGDLTFAINIPQLPETSKYAQQEELSHRNNNRSGARQIFLEIASTPAIQKSLDHLAKSYDTFSPTDKVDEVIAKSFRDDAETELGISEDDIWNNLTSLWKGATDAGIDLNHYVDVQSQISERGRKFNEYVQGQRGQGDVTTQPERETVRGDGSGYLQAVRGTGTESGAITRPVSQDGVRAELQQGSVPEGNTSPTRLTDTPAFKKWFGDSKVVDADGNPLVVYHGTNRSFDQFSPTQLGSATKARSAKQGYFFTNSPDIAHFFADDRMNPFGERSFNDAPNGNPNIIPAYLRIERPLRTNIEELHRLAANDEIDKGRYDGVIATDAEYGQQEILVFEPTQIKSAIGNNGNFDPEDPSILKAKRTITRRILNRIDKTLASQDISTTRALENIVNKNLQQLKKVDEDAFEQVVKLATTEAQATIEALQTGQRDPAILDAIRKRNYDDVKVTLTVAGVAQKYTAGMTHSGTLHGQPSTLVRIGDEQFVVQSWLARELKAVLDKPHDANVLQRFVDKLDSFGMAGPLDLFFHGTNVIATLIGGTPYVGTDVLSRTVGNTPVTKWITTLVQLWRSDPEALLQNDPQMLRDMADAGVIPQGYASETYAKRFAGTSELKSPLPFHRGLAPDLGPMLRGPKGLDIRSRILLWKVGKHMNPDATATEMHDFVNQLGIYNQKLQSQLVRFLQQSRLGKFSVAGTTMTKNGILAWLNKNPLPIEDLPLADRTWIRAQQQFSGGLLGIGLILWVALSKLYRGVFPWNDEKSQFLRIPLNDKDRHSWLVERIYGPEGDVYVNLAFFSPLLARGADALGISGAYNTWVLGGNKTQMAENAATGMINAAIHPVSTSPTTKAVFEGLTGNEMHVRGLRDKQGQAGMDLWPLDLPKGSGAGRRALEGALDLNPFIGNIIHSFGVNRSEKHPNLLTDSENRILLESLMEYTAPRLIKKTDVGKKRGFIQEQKRSMH